jgi:FixJ family two-component response regulator
LTNDEAGLELQRSIHDHEEALPVVFVAEGAPLRLVVQAMRQGAVDVLQWPTSKDALLKSLRAGLLRSCRLGDLLATSEYIAGRFAPLTGREREVLRLIVQGYPSKVIARILHIGKRTVDYHRGQIICKVGARSVAELVHLTDTLDMLSYLRRMQQHAQSLELEWPFDPQHPSRWGAGWDPD